MNIFVTGCAGFIGSSLCEKLLYDKNLNIYGIDNFDTNYDKTIKINNLKTLNSSNFNFIEGDILDENLMENIFSSKNIDIVVHLAAKAGVRQSLLNPEEYVSVNIGGTIKILNLMKKYGCKKIVFASSSSVYGNANYHKFSEELTNLKQISPYAVTKKSCEEFIETYSLLFGIKAVCLRFFTVYGTRQRPDLAISKFSHAIYNNLPINIFGDGSNYRDYTYIDDILQGIISSIEYDKSDFEIINIGSEKPITLNELIVHIEREFNKKAVIKYLPMQNGDVDRTFADITKARKLLNYEPKVDFQEGLHVFVKNTDFRMKQYSK